MEQPLIHDEQTSLSEALNLLLKAAHTLQRLRKLLADSEMTLDIVDRDSEDPDNRKRLKSADLLDLASSLRQADNK